MKKVISKILIIFILITLLFEFSFSNSLISYAAQDNDYHLYGLSDDAIKNIASISTGIISIILWIPKFIVTGTTWLINQAIGGVAGMENGAGDDVGTITPFKVFFNKYEILKINIFESREGSFMTPFRNALATWYYAMRVIATAILLVILIYVGIRMALASVAEDKAKYKKMLFDWVMRTCFNICYALYCNICYIL